MNKRTVLLYGAGRGLGAFLHHQFTQSRDFRAIGLSRSRPGWLGAAEPWITADLSRPQEAVQAVSEQLRATPVDILLYNVGLWEKRAFEPDYDFLNDEPAYLLQMIHANISSCILQIQLLLPKLWQSPKPHIIFTGSTSALDHTGRPEVTFNASKFALRGIAQSLRAQYKTRGLAVTLINPGYIDTQPEHSPDETLQLHAGTQLAMDDVWQMLSAVLRLSAASCPLEVNLPAMQEKEC